MTRRTNTSVDRPIAVAGRQLESLLIDTVEFLRASRRTGVIAVTAGQFKGLIYMENGVLKHTVLGRKRGEAALLAMLHLTEVQVSFKEGSYPHLPVNVSIPWGEFMAALLEQAGDGACAS